MKDRHPGRARDQGTDWLDGAAALPDCSGARFLERRPGSINGDDGSVHEVRFVLGEKERGVRDVLGHAEQRRMDKQLACAAKTEGIRRWHGDGNLGDDAARRDCVARMPLWMYMKAVFFVAESSAPFDAQYAAPAV